MHLLRNVGNELWRADRNGYCQTGPLCQRTVTCTLPRVLPSQTHIKMRTPLRRPSGSVADECLGAPSPQPTCWAEGSWDLGALGCHKAGQKPRPSWSAMRASQGGIGFPGFEHLYKDNCRFRSGGLIFLCKQARWNRCVLSIMLLNMWTSEFSSSAHAKGHP